MNLESNSPSNETTLENVLALANDLTQILKAQEIKIALAESCTCGMAAAILGQIPGISQHLCGSFVTYRNSTKLEWLNVPEETLETFSATSLETSWAMSAGALEKTEEANIAAAITGHLGPDSEDGLDGQVFVVLQTRRGIKYSKEAQHRLSATTRSARQLESVGCLFQNLIQWLDYR